ncbi:hypothetical protein BD749_3793 [Pontibacter ramchanderi]|uniref:Uncharacterized protein n=1 Tax=Pontibacter ramchanderi TaxID=1179743 RepID=A0A2N3U756_9BACT|nr:hypothetical protein BD749_3793 [Pontibacter ramchanderi]
MKLHGKKPGDQPGFLFLVGIANRQTLRIATKLTLKN